MNEVALSVSRQNDSFHYCHLYITIQTSCNLSHIQYLYRWLLHKKKNKLLLTYTVIISYRNETFLSKVKYPNFIKGMS